VSRIPAHSLPTSRLFPLFVVSISLLTLALAPHALASGPYVIGSGNTVTADPNIARPSTKPCVVPLLDHAQFANFTPNTFTYTPPADCPGPWAKVIFAANITVTPGIQFDRTANFWLGATNIYFGTTAEPSPNLGPKWHVESDLTDYTPIFMITQQGTADIGNIVGQDGLTSIIFASANLEFFPLAHGQIAPVTANTVLPLSAGPTGGTVSLNNTASTLSGTFTMPTNIENAYLDVFAQSQSNDEFWYTCVPNDVSAELFSCGNTGFRETEITIDNQPAGVAPVFPWIFTGGIDPFLWFPIPGVQTLNFVPYRVDLTPFAAVLSNGQPHTVSLSVFNANSSFSATASLLLYLDADSTQVTGALTKNTLATAPSPVVTENLNATSTAIAGNVKVASNRSFVLSGFVNTSHGKVTTTLAQGVSFANRQSFKINNSTFQQDISQATDIHTQTTIAASGKPTVTNVRNFEFPLTVDIVQQVQSNGNINQTTTISQTYDVQQFTSQNGTPFTSLLTNAGEHQDTLVFNSSGQLVSAMNQSSAQLYDAIDSTGVSYVCTLTAANNALTSFAKTCSK
jgi:hypothetical protein